MDMSLSKLRKLVIDIETWGAAVHLVAKSRPRLRDWPELIVVVQIPIAHTIHCYIIRVIWGFFTVYLTITYHTTNLFFYKIINVRLIRLLDLLADKHFCLALWIFMESYFEYFR